MPKPRPKSLGIGSIFSTFAARCVVLRLVAASIIAAVGGGNAGRVAAETGPLDPVLEAAERQRIDAIGRAMPATVSVFVPGGGGGGSGVLISPDGFALTNFHVSSPAGAHMRCGLSDGKIYDAVIVGIDPVGDLALIKLLGRDDFPVARFADSGRAQVGDWCMAIGNPFLLATNLQPSVSFGILSGVGRYQYPSGTLLEYGDCLQTDAAINPGNSGGPLFDVNGDLLGIIGRASFEKRGRVNVGVGYAISIRQAENFLGYLHSGRVVDHATLGATVTSDPERGVVVSNILESSDAYRRGLRYGTEILEIDGRPVETANEVQNVLATLPSDWRVKLTYRRDGATVDTLVRLAGVHRRDELLKKMAAALPPPPPRRGGRGGPGGPQDPEGPDRPQGPEESEGEAPDATPRDGADGDGEDHEQGAEADRGESKLPEAVREHYTAREGFANYHFNRMHQERFIDRLRAEFPAGAGGPVTENGPAAESDPAAKSDPAAEGEPAGESDEQGESSGLTWVIRGTTEDDPPSPVTVRVGPAVLSMSIGDRDAEIRGRSELFGTVEAGSAAGLLSALDAWRRMLARGPRRFGETTYWGTMPLGGERPLRDCTVAFDSDMEVRWIQRVENGMLEAIEVIAGRDSDPAELWIDRGEGAKSAPPSRFELRYGTESVLSFRVDSWELAAASSADSDRGGEDAAGADGDASGAAEEEL